MNIPSPRFTIGERYTHRNPFDPSIISVWKVVAVTKRHVRFAVSGKINPMNGRAQQRYLTHRQAQEALASAHLDRLETGIAIAVIPPAHPPVDLHRFEDDGGPVAPVLDLDYAEGQGCR